MKKLIYALIIIFMVGFAPVITYEREVTHGVTAIEHKSIAVWAYERYQEVQKGAPLEE